MEKHIDREAGFATFRKARSFCLRLDGTLDLPLALAAARQVLRDGEAVRLRLECSSLARVEPDAARVLASALLVWVQRRDDRSIDILNLDLHLHQAMAWHPLRVFTDTDELLFFDPDAGSPFGDPAQASRH